MATKTDELKETLNDAVAKVVRIVSAGVEAIDDIPPEERNFSTYKELETLNKILTTCLVRIQALPEHGWADGVSDEDLEGQFE